MHDLPNISLGESFLAPLLQLVSVCLLTRQCPDFSD
ncbi:MAG: hypothetical protein ACI8T1_002417, partial [Verrucomicrobiales bacterium]